MHLLGRRLASALPLNYSWASMENLFRGKCENIEASAFIAHDVVRREERVFNARERAGGPAVD